MRKLSAAYNPMLIFSPEEFYTGLFWVCLLSGLSVLSSSIGSTYISRFTHKYMMP